ncbi:strawberry notch C-terminal domain-containing protein [Polaromonas sp.]|uniref:strawberry notch C-terminal domain-containing protein n=1 Tax=Polaromonas sp. TaxID=1869339 RepID=UPI00352B0F02
MTKWIDLGDASGARLKLASIDVQGVPTLHIFITGMAFTNPKWTRAIRELGFNTPASKKYLVRRVESGERLVASRFHSVFPSARLITMAPEVYMLNLGAKAAPSKKAEEGDANVELRGVRQLGRNEEGHEVFDSLSGRFFQDANGARVLETEAQQPHQFLRLARIDQPLPQGKDLSDALMRVSLGFVRSMDMGEVQHSEDYDAFRSALYPIEIPADADELLSSAIDSAMLRHVRAHSDVPLEAYSPMARLYDFLPPYRGKRRGEGAIPAPLSIAAQRLLGDTSTKTVLYPNAFDGAAFAFLPAGTQIRAYRGQEGVVDLSDFAAKQDGVTWLGRYTAASESGAGALFFNADPIDDGHGRRDYIDALQCMRSLAPGARAIMVLSADNEAAAGRVMTESGRFLQALGSKYSLEDVFETAPILSRKSGGARGLRVYSVRNVEALDKAEQHARIEGYLDQGLPVLASWDQVKSHIDETINRIDLKEAESEGVDLERAAANEAYQRPYLAFSKVGEARTMVPANLQASTQSYMTRLEQAYGTVDGFVENQLGMGFNTLEANFSPEQVDATAIAVSRILVGRSSILADDTGLGKGRVLAALATWANKRSESVIFVTEKANLFSDLARDLKHIGEWDRFRPLVLNSDGEITYEETPGVEPVVLAKGVSSDLMANILEQNSNLQDLQVNIVFLTYSQIATSESAKAVWIKNQLANSLVIFDEAHVAAGSDSNIAVQVDEIATLAKHVQFSSATWAKSHDNMHIYQRAFPSTVSVATLSETMRKGGDSFSELFSTMLSAEGALIRREHDLSKLDVEMVIDDKNRARNEDVSDKVADVLGSASYISGDMQQVFIRANAQSVAKLKGAREIRNRLVKAKLFSSSFGAGSVIYQVMKAVQGSLNATHVADLAIDSVGRGMKPVIVSDATGESLVEALIEEIIRKKGGDRPESIRMPTLQDMLRHVIYKRLATIRVEEIDQTDVLDDEPNGDQEPANADGEDLAGAPPVILAEAAGQDAVLVIPAAAGGAGQATEPAGGDEEGIDVQAAFVVNTSVATAEAVPVELAEGDGVVILTKKSKRKRVFKDVLISDLADIPEQAAQRYAEGLKEIEEKIKLVPDMPVISFDVMAQRLRDANITVAEISGRKHSMVREDGPDGKWRLIPRAKTKKAVKATIRSYNNGATQVVVMNRSAASGVSMHSSPRFLDQSRRHMIEHQIPEDPVIRVQLLGRVNRYDQLSTPLITSASTGIYGEVRYLMMQNRKLARMSANVRSSRDNAMALKGVVDLFNSVGRSAIQGFLQDNPLIAKRLGIGESETEHNPDIVNKLTMRIPLLRVKEQEVVYEEVYSRYDEILLRAELEGQNPLRPNDMDIKAKQVEEIVFFGDDSPVDEFTSAFDAPVMARRIEWEQTRNPLSFNAVREAVKVNTERLLQSGYLSAGGGENSVPEVNAALLKKVVGGYHGMTRLAHMSTDTEKYEQAMVHSPAAKRSYIKYAWMKEYLPMLMPGSRIPLVGQITEDRTDNLEETIVTDVRPPADESELLDAGKWKITVVTSGAERPQTYSLRSVLSSVGGIVRVGEVTGDLSVDHWGPRFAEGIYGSAREKAMIRNFFEMTRRGKEKYEATVLSGNMYLAAEWAAATRQGNSAIYSDDSGFRHRVIMLDKDAGRIDPAFLPVRVSDAEALTKFLLPLTAAPAEPAPAGRDEKVHVLDTSFKSAMAALEGGMAMARRDAVFAIQPGKLIAISCSPKDVRRIKASLTSGQVGVRRGLLGPSSTAQQDVAHVVVRSFTTKKDLAKLPVGISKAMRTLSMASTADIFSATGGGSSDKAGKVAVISLEVDTPEKAGRAIDLVRKFSGLEVYVSTEELKVPARAAIREVLQARRAEARRVQEELRAAVAGSSQAARAAADGSVQYVSDIHENDASAGTQQTETVS